MNEKLRYLRAAASAAMTFLALAGAASRPARAEAPSDSVAAA